MISKAKIIARIKQIQNSIQQAQTMLESMEQFKHLVVKKFILAFLENILRFLFQPGTDDQREKTSFYHS